MKPATFPTAVRKLIKFIQCKATRAKYQILEILWEGGFRGYGSVARVGVGWGLIVGERVGGEGPLSRSSLLDMTDSIGCKGFD